MTNVALHELQQMKSMIDNAERIMIVVHEKPDGDALGSACGLAGYLLHQNISFQIFSPTPRSPAFDFLPFSTHITEDVEVWETFQPDTVVLVDSGSLLRSGVDQIVARMTKRPVIINVDHHASNEMFGDLNIVKVDAASTTEIIYRFYCDLGIPLDQNIATCLLNGMMTDTMTFHNAATSASVVEASSHLLTFGAKIRDIAKNIFNNKKLTTLKLWGKALSRLSMSNEWGIAVTFITEEDLKEAGADEEDSSGLSNFLNSLDARAILVLTEQKDGSLKGSLRTTRDDVDVMKFAKLFGGGGHKKAAGFTVKGKIEQTPDGFRVV